MMNPTNDSGYHSDGILVNEESISHTIQPMSSFEVEQPLPSVEEIRGGRSEDSDFSSRQGYSSKLVVFLLLLVVVLLSLTIGLTVGLKAEEDGIRSVEDERNPEVQQDRFEKIVKFLTDSGVSNITDLNNSRSPQSLASWFMAAEDPLAMDLPVAHSQVILEGYEFVTRYVVMVLYFSTLGENWSKKHHFRTEMPTCQWWEINLDQETRHLYKYTGVICNENRVITDLLLPESNLKGSIPTELALLFSLKTIVFNDNHISGSIPSSFEQLINLRDLWLSHNELTGTLPALIERFIGLRSLDVSHNFLTGILPNQVGSFQFVEMLALDNNEFTGNVDSIFNLMSNGYGGLRKLKYLYLEGNRFDGTIGASFLYLEGSSDLASPLIALDLSNNRFTGTLPSHVFSGFPDLQVLDASYNLLSGKLPENIIPNEALAFLALQGNSLTGELSGLLPELQGLTHLDVSNNQLNSWHVDLGAMMKLKYLFLANNPFPVGSFPTFVTLLTNLQELSVKGTQRTGTIPTSLGNLNQLVLLDLDNNQFSGAIPSALGMLDKLQFLLLNRNRLEGSVPSDFRHLTALRLLFLDSNELTGDLAPVCDGRDPFVVADCAGTATNKAPVSCFCCDQCCSKDHACNDDNLVPSQDGVWKFGYQRLQYTFGDELAYEVSNVP